MSALKTIGLLTDHIYSDYAINIWNGIRRGARARGYSIITYRGGPIQCDEKTGGLKPNAVYDNIDRERMAGFILVSTTIASALGADAFEAFCKGLQPRPIVSIGPSPDFVHRCLVDNSSGFYALVTHLIREHGCRSFAYLGGPPMAREAEVRYQAFRQALADNTIAFNEQLLHYGNFLRSQARVGVQAFINTKIPFDAVVAANDDMALSAAVTLQELGYKVPDDVKIIGFDDIPNALFADPPLSTVRQPLYTQAYRAVNMLIDLAEGGTAAKEEYIQTLPVLRKSCGCGQGDADVSAVSRQFRTAYTCGRDEQARMVTEITRRIRHSLDAQKLPLVEELVGLFDRDLTTGGRSYLEKTAVLLSAVQELNDMDVWQEVFMSVEKAFADRLSGDLWKSFRALVDGQKKLIAEQTMRLQSQRYVLSQLENRYLRETLQELASSFNITDLHKHMAAHFKARLDISSAYLLFFEEGKTDRCRAVAGFDETGTLDVSAYGEPFPARRLLPDPRQSLAGKSYYVCALYGTEEDIGLIVLETGKAAPFVYESISTQVESSVRGSMLLENSARSRRSLMEWNRQITSLVTPMIASIKQVTEIIMEKTMIVTALNETSRLSSKNISQTADVIHDISNKSAEMTAITNIIDDIATTVKLVSINASIEATHAGEFGHGFQVLAREIGKLSESTRRNAESIALTLQSVAGMIRTSIDSSRESAASFKEQETYVHDLLDALNTISEYMKQMDETSNRILSIMDNRER